MAARGQSRLAVGFTAPHGRFGEALHRRLQEARCRAAAIERKPGISTLRDRRVRRVNHPVRINRPPAEARGGFLRTSVFLPFQLLAE